MPKTATLSVRLDEELKDGAQRVLDEMGLPMSLAVELYLRQIVAKGRLPFALGSGEPDPEEAARREQREHDFWKAFTLWYFKVWPHFDSDEVRQHAKEDIGFDEFVDGFRRYLYEYVEGDTGGYPDRMSEEQWLASRDLAKVELLLSDAKELIYWALDMERTFVPSLSARYSSQADDWRYRYLCEQARGGEADDDDPPIANGVIGARYFDVDECGEG